MDIAQLQALNALPAAFRQSQLLRLNTIIGDLANIPRNQFVRAVVGAPVGQLTQLQLPNGKVLTEALPSFKPGQELFVRLSGSAQKPSMEVLNPTLPTARQSPPLAVGEEVLGQVVEPLGQDRVLISLKGGLVEARAPEGLPVGVLLPLKVEAVGPVVVLQSGQSVEAPLLQLVRPNLTELSSSPAALPQLAGALEPAAQSATQPELRAGLQSLRSFLTQLVPETTKPGQETVAKFVQDGGMQYEAKLAEAVADPERLRLVPDHDLKGQLLRTLGLLKNEPPTPRTEQLTGDLTIQVARIESQQAVNALARLHGDAWQLQVPWLTPAGWRNVLIGILPDGEPGAEHSSSGGYHLFFALELDRLGELRIEASVTGRSVQATLYAASEPAREELRLALGGLQERLTALGYPQVWLDVRPLAQLAPNRQATFAALAAGVPLSHHVIDTRA